KTELNANTERRHDDTRQTTRTQTRKTHHRPRSADALRILFRAAPHDSRCDGSLRLPHHGHIPAPTPRRAPQPQSQTNPEVHRASESGRVEASGGMTGRKRIKLAQEAVRQHIARSTNQSDKY